jgi:hypothetical protein
MMCLKVVKIHGLLDGYGKPSTESRFGGRRSLLLNLKVLGYRCTLHRTKITPKMLSFPPSPIPLPLRNHSCCRHLPLPVPSRIQFAARVIFLSLCGSLTSPDPPRRLLQRSSTQPCPFTTTLCSSASGPNACRTLSHQHQHPVSPQHRRGIVDPNHASASRLSRLPGCQHHEL